MSKKRASSFSARQFMIESNYEVYRYKDTELLHIEPHYHDFYEIYFFLGGEIEYILDNHLYRLKKGDILMIPPNTLHHPLIHNHRISYERIVLWISSSMWRHLTNLDPDMDSCMNQHLTNLLLIRTPDSVWHGIYGTLLELLEDYQSRRLCWILNGFGNISTILTQLNRTIYQDMIQTDASETTLTNILQYIQTNLDELLTLEDLSEKFLVSKYHIAHIFKRRIGISFYQYVIKCRLIHAKNKIIANEPINKIYEICGFSDYSCFYRAFKKEYGVSPREFRKEYEEIYR